MKPIKLVDITPKPATVQELFEGHPERWTRGGMWSGEQGNRCNRAEAVACCLGAAIGYIYEDRDVCNEAVESALRVVRFRTQNPDCSIPHYNDKIAPNFNSIVELAREARI